MKTLSRGGRCALAEAGGILLLITSTTVGIPSDCTRTSVGLIPLTELGNSLYQAKQGGLYPNASNIRPAAHEAAGLACGPHHSTARRSRHA
jgi:hypothetical protein